MAEKKRQEVREEDITGPKCFDRLAPLLTRRHGDACARDKAGNRRLHLDQYGMLTFTKRFPAS